jgi:hypothetical protein
MLNFTKLLNELFEVVSGQILPNQLTQMNSLLLQILVVFLDGMVGADPGSIFDVLESNLVLSVDLRLVKVNHCGCDGSWLGHLLIEEIPLKNLITNLLDIIPLVLAEFELVSKHVCILSRSDVNLGNVSQNDLADFEDLSLGNISQRLELNWMQIDELSSTGQVDASQGDYLKFLTFHVFLILNIVINILGIFDDIVLQIEGLSEPSDDPTGLLELLVLIGLTGENVVVFLAIVDVDQIQLGVEEIVDGISDSSRVVG